MGTVSYKPKARDGASTWQVAQSLFFDSAARPKYLRATRPTSKEDFFDGTESRLHQAHRTIVDDSVQIFVIEAHQI